MDISVIKNGKFSFTIGAMQLSRGLRTTKRNPRNGGYLTVANGCVGRDGVLQSLEEVNKIALYYIKDSFPFPQIFVFTNLIIVCDATRIYEWMGNALHLEYTIDPADAGCLWTAVDYYDCIYLSNGSVAIVRDPQSDTYALSTTLPYVTAMCDYNGQVIVGAAGVAGLGYNLVTSVEPIGTSVEIIGTFS
jgi:hypothetical protein